MPTRLVRHFLLGLFLLSLSFPTSALAVAVVKKKAAAHKAAPGKRVATKQVAVARKSVVTRKSATPLRRGASRTAVAARVRPIVRSSPWTEPSFGEPTVGDNEEGEDPVVRKAAVDALGPFNGSLVVVDPLNGRVLTIVNQKLAFQGGHTPCSTVKLITSLAALKEGLIDRTTSVRIGKRLQMDMTEALAVSNNTYFAQLGTKLGYEKVNSYARMFGIGEKPDFIDRYICDTLKIRRDYSILHHSRVHFGEIQNGGDQRDESAATVGHDA